MTKQTEIPGTEAPKDPDIEHALDHWLDAKDEQRRTADTTRTAHAALVLHMQTAGVATYPYVDRSTGKKRRVVITAEPKAKTARFVSPRRQDSDVDDEADAETKRDERKARDADKVEKRKVSRKSVAKELDPFAGTRTAMDRGVLDDAEDWMRQNGAEP